MNNPVTPAKILFSIYPSPEVFVGAAARIVWSYDGVEAKIELNPTLSAHDICRVLAWAGKTLECFALPDGSGFTGKPFEVGPVLSLQEINRGHVCTPMELCVDCANLFHPDSSPHVDRCWFCAEQADLYGAGR